MGIERALPLTGLISGASHKEASLKPMMVEEVEEVEEVEDGGGGGGGDGVDGDDENDLDKPIVRKIRYTYKKRPPSQCWST
jgi:hypothetical protein